MADTPLAPVNNAYKFFIANIDFQTTALEVKHFFCAFGNVNHVKLIPHTSTSISTTDSALGGRHRHKGYGFLFMLDEPSTLAVERYVNAFPENKIEMLGRKGVFVKRQLGMSRDSNGRGTNMGRINNSTNNNLDFSANHQYSWGAYIDHGQQVPYNSTAPGTTATYSHGTQYTGQYSQAPYAAHYQQQLHAFTGYSLHGLTHYNEQQSTSSSSQYTQPQQYANGSVYPATYQAPQQSYDQHTVQQTPITMYQNQAQGYSNQHKPQLQLPPSQSQLPPLTIATTTEYSQNSQQPPMQMPQQASPAIMSNNYLNRWDQLQQQHSLHPTLTPHTSTQIGSLGVASGGGGKRNAGGGGGGRGGGACYVGGRSGTVGGRNGRETRRDRPY